MSNTVSTRVWRGSGHTKTKLLVLVKIADNVNNDAVGFAGRKYLAKNVRISERQVQRLIDQIQETGELYVRPGNGRGNETLSLITIGLSQDGIKQRLIDYFEMSPFEAENVSLSIIQKGDKFRQQRETKTTIKGDIAERKTGTTINHNTLTSNTKTLAANAAPADPIPEPIVDPVPDPIPEPEVKPILKEVPKPPTPVPATPSPVDKRNMHQRGVDAYYDNLPDGVRPKIRTFGGQVGQGIKDLLKADYTPEQIGIATAEAYKDNWYSEKKSKPITPQELGQSIEILLRKAKFNGHGTPTSERTETAPANGVGAGVLASDPAKAEGERRLLEIRNRQYARMQGVPGTPVGNTKRASGSS